MRQLNLEATLELKGAASDGELPKLNIVAATGRVMANVGNFGEPVIVDLAGASFDKDPTPILADHDVTRPVGHTISQNIGPDAIRVSAVVSSAMAGASDVVSSLRNGFPFQASIGADVIKAQRVKKGEEARVNGLDLEGPLLVARKTNIREISVTVLGADSSTSVDVAASVKRRGNKPMTEFNQWLEAGGIDADTLEDAQRDFFLQQFEELKAARVTGDDRLQDRREAIAAEEDRLDGVRAVFSDPAYADIKQVQVGNKKVGIKAFKKKALTELNDDGEPAWSRDAVELRLLQAHRDQVPEFSVHMEDDNVDMRALSCAILRAASAVPEKSAVHRGTWYEREFGLECMFDENALDLSHSAQVRKYSSLHGYMGLCCQLAGKPYSGSRNNPEFIRAFFESRRTLQASGFTTQEAANVLGDVANKALLGAFNAQETVWDRFCAVRTLNDFKTHNMYRLTVGGGYAEVGADGELKHGKLTDEKETLAADTYGQIVALTRKELINDDMGAFLEIPRGLGRLAALKIEEAVFTLLLANTGSFFATGNNNLNTGAGSNLTLAGLSASEATFMDQVDGFDLPILVTPDRILVGTQDWVDANRFLSDTELRGQTAGTEITVANPHAGKFQPIKSPYINNTSIKNMSTGAAITGQDSDQWYMFADPGRIAAMNVGFIGGNRTPTLEQSDTDFNTLGTQWRSYHDWGVAFGSEEGAVKNDGA